MRAALLVYESKVDYRKRRHSGEARISVNDYQTNSGDHAKALEARNIPA
jgi:hypothetical protein